MTFWSVLSLCGYCALVRRFMNEPAATVSENTLAPRRGCDAGEICYPEERKQRRRTASDGETDRGRPRQESPVNHPSPWPIWVVSREPRAARATLVLCIVSFTMVSAAAFTVGARGIWLELVLSVGFLAWATGQWACVERRRYRETVFRRDVERYIHALSHSSQE